MANIASVNTVCNINNMRILFWNARSINKRKYDLPHLLLDVDIFLCVESWLKDEDNVNSKKKYIDSTLVPGFVQLQKNRTHTVGGGILIMVRKSIAFSEIDVNSPHPSLEVCKIRLTHTNPKLDIIVCYRGSVKPPDKLTQNTFNNLISLIDKNSHSILVGDFNAHNIIWNSNHTDKYGEYLQNSTSNQNLFLHNHNTFTYQNPSNAALSNLDLLFSTLNISDKITISVFDETWGSDHFPLLCTVNMQKNI